MKLDYIVVGLGLAGLAFIEELIAANKSFLVFEDRSQTSSLVAGGIYNPVIFKTILSGMECERTIGSSTSFL